MPLTTTDRGVERARLAPRRDRAFDDLMRTEYATYYADSSLISGAD